MRFQKMPAMVLRSHGVALRCTYALPIIFWLVCCAAFAAPGEDHFERAKAYYDRGEHAAAVIELKNILSKDPDLAEVRLLLGQTHLRLGNATAAVKELRRARELGAAREAWLIALGRAYLLQHQPRELLQQISAEPEDPPALKARIHALHAEAHLLLLEVAQAEKDLAQAQALAPANVDVLVVVARFAFARQDRTGAYGYLDQVLAAAPESVEAWVLRGDMERTDGRLQEAIDAYSKALDVQPGHPSARFGKTAAHISGGDYTAAARELEHAQPNLLMTHYLKGVLAFHEDAYDEAENQLSAVLRMAPAHSPSQLLFGAIDYHRSRYESAEMHLSGYLRSVPGNIGATKLLAATRLKSNRPRDAIALLETARNPGNDDAQLLALLGTAYLQHGEHERGAELLQAAAALEPGLTAIRTNLALGYLGVDDPDGAIAELNVVLQLDPEAVRADVLLVFVHMQRQQYDAALAAAQALAKKEPKAVYPHNLIAAAYVGKGDLAAARTHFEQALHLDPSFLAAALNLARIDEQQGDTASAQQRYRKVLQSQPDHLGALLELTRLSLDAGDRQQAIGWLEKAQRAHPGSLDAGILLTRQYLDQHHTEKALAVAWRLQKELRDHPAALRMLGETQLAGNDHAGASHSFERLVALRPESADARYWLARTFAQAGDTPRARQTLAQALEKDNRHLPALHASARLALKEDHAEFALHTAERVQDYYPSSPVGFHLEGDIHRQVGNHVQAASAYQEANDRAPNAASSVGLYQVRKMLGDHQQSVAALTGWLEHRPDDVGVRLLLAAEYQQQGRADDAIREYEAVRAARPGEATVWNNLAWLYEMKNDSRSLEYAEQAYSLAPRPEVADTLGWILVNRGQTKRSLTLIQEASIYAPHNLGIRYHLAAALHKAGQQEQARKELRRLLASPDDFPDRAAAEKLYAELKQEQQ